MSNEKEVELVDAFYMLIESMKNNGIKNLYGIPGIPITALVRSWQAEGGKWFGFRHETNAAMAAGVSGYLTGVPGVCITTPAPGCLNGLAGAANATTNGWPPSPRRHRCSERGSKCASGCSPTAIRP